MANKLVAWDIETDAPVVSTFFEWGSVYPSTMDEKNFFVKNESTQYVAEGVTIHLEDAVSDPSFEEQLLFSMDEVTFTGVVSLGDIPPLATSPEITIRRVTASDTESGTYDVIVEAESWST